MTQHDLYERWGRMRHTERGYNVPHAPTRILLFLFLFAVDVDVLFCQHFFFVRPKKKHKQSY